MPIPYQPTYSLQPKYGFRYGPSSFAPPQAPIAPPPAGLQGSPATPPPVMGTQQGTAAPAYTQDPLQAGGDLQNQQAEAYNQARINQAQSYGYTQGVQNPAGIVRAVPVVGNFMADSLSMGQDSKYTYGNPGTYDAQGNVFADKGRAYDPITGAPAQSYTKMTGENSWLGNAYGVGTEGGLFGSDSGYGKLRAAGESPASSFLGSYDNSIYKQMDMDPSITTVEGARAARRRGENSPIENLANTITQNTINAKTDEFGNIPTGPVWGTQPGDYVQSDQGPLMISDGGQMQNPQGGTTVMIDGVSFVNANVSKGTKTEFKGTPFEREVPLSQEQFDIISDRTSPTSVNTIPDELSGPQMDSSTTINTCFPKGTKISMADNTVKNIEDIAIGDKIIAFDENNKLVNDEVTKVHSHTINKCCSDSLLKVTLSNSKEVIVTSNHPFYMPEHNGFKWIGLFEKGELVMTKGGMMYPVSSIEVLDIDEQTVYNLEVKDTHTYIAEDLRVHNGSGGNDSAGNDNVDRSNPNEMAAREKSFAESKGYSSTSTGRPDDTGKSMDQFVADVNAGKFSSEQSAESDALNRAATSGNLGSNSNVTSYNNTTKAR